VLGLLNEFLRVLATGSEGRGALGGRGRVVVVVVAMAVGGRAAAVARTDGSLYRRVFQPSCSYGKPSRKDDIPLLKCATKDADEPRRHPNTLFNGQRESSRRTLGNRTVCRNEQGPLRAWAGAEEGFTGETGEYQCLIECAGDQNTHNGLGCLVEGKKTGASGEEKVSRVRPGQVDNLQHAVTQVRRGTTAGFAHIAVMHCTSLHHVKTSPQWAATRRKC